MFEVARKLPALICHRCADNLSRACKIKKLALETDNFFKQITTNDDVNILDDIMNGIEYRVIKEEPKFTIKEDPEDFNDDYAAEYLIDEDDPNAMENLINYELDHSNIKMELLTDQLKNVQSFSETEELPKIKHKTPKKPKPKGPRPPIFPKIHQCQVEGCKKIFKNYTRLKTHGLVHSNERNFSCDECGSVFKAHTSMMRHKESHAGINWICDICGKVFANRMNIHVHMNVHMKSKKPICHLCGKTVSKPSMLKIHMLYSHGGEKNFKCNICDKAFFTKGKLKQHIDATHGERPWVCELCNRNFSKRYKLGEHMKQTHKITLLPAKRFTCSLCGVSFDRNKLLQIHLRDQHQVVVEDLDEPFEDSQDY